MQAAIMVLRQYMQPHFEGKTNSVGSLVELGADVNAKADIDATALHAAASSGHPNVISTLIEHGADVHATDNNGKTPLDYAKQKKHKKAAELLQKYMKEATTQTPNGARTPRQRNEATSASSSARPTQQAESSSRRANRPASIASLESADEFDVPLRPAPSGPSRSPESSPAVRALSGLFERNLSLTNYQGSKKVFSDPQVIKQMGDYLKAKAAERNGRDQEKVLAAIHKQYQAAHDNDNALLQNFWYKASKAAFGKSIVAMKDPEQWGLKGVVGMDAIKDELKMEVISPLRELWNPDQGSRSNRNIQLQQQAGVLLTGLPGIGKTFIAQKIAEELDVPLIQLDHEDVDSRYAGDAPKAIKEAFEQAAEMAPSVVCIDEIDGFLTNRQNLSADQDHVGQITDTMKRCLERAPKDNVLVIGTTNHPENLDRAATRPGRIDIQLEVSPPERQARYRLFEKYLSEAHKGKQIYSPRELGQFAESTRGFSTAAIVSVCNSAAKRAHYERKSEIPAATVKDMIAKAKSGTPRKIYGAPFSEAELRNYPDLD
jgi:ATP-dependent 26S proteasome regulatory subunit